MEGKTKKPFLYGKALGGIVYSYSFTGEGFCPDSEFFLGPFQAAMAMATRGLIHPKKVKGPYCQAETPSALSVKPAPVRDNTAKDSSGIFQRTA